jgi:large subunit ribosomal protein L19
VSRAKLYYLRGKVGKKARVREVQRRGALSSADAVAAGAGDGTQPPESDAGTAADAERAAESEPAAEPEPAAESSEPAREREPEGELEAEEAGAEAPRV